MKAKTKNMLEEAYTLLEEDDSLSSHLSKDDLILTLRNQRAQVKRLIGKAVEFETITEGE